MGGLPSDSVWKVGHDVSRIHHICLNCGCFEILVLTRPRSLHNSLFTSQSESQLQTLITPAPTATAVATGVKIGVAMMAATVVTTVVVDTPPADLIWALSLKPVLHQFAKCSQLFVKILYLSSPSLLYALLTISLGGKAAFVLRISKSLSLIKFCRLVISIFFFDIPDVVV